MAIMSRHHLCNTQSTMLMEGAVTSSIVSSREPLLGPLAAVALRSAVALRGSCSSQSVAHLQRPGGVGPSVIRCSSATAPRIRYPLCCGKQRSPSPQVPRLLQAPPHASPASRTAGQGG